MKRFPSGSIAAVLCVAILFVFASHPSRENANASMKAEVSAIESVAQSLAKSIEQQQMMNVEATEADRALVAKMNDLFSRVDQLQGNFGELHESVRLTSAVIQDDEGCTCAEKLADLQKQIDELKSKVAEFEQVKKVATASTASSSYAVALPKASASGGSTGSVAARVTSGGSTGSSTVYFQPATSGRHWTYPGSINSHLAGTHGVDPSGMTHEQMLSLHDSLHESGQLASSPMVMAPATVRQRSVTRQSSTYAPAVMSNCPGGVCPATGGGVRRTGLLGFGILGR